MERIERQGRAFAQGMSQRYRDMRSNPMGDGGQGLHSARSTADDGQDGSRNTSRKRIALAVSSPLHLPLVCTDERLQCSRCRKRKIKCSGDVGNGQGCTNCKNNTQEPCAFLRVVVPPLHEIELLLNCYPRIGTVDKYRIRRAQFHVRVVALCSSWKHCQLCRSRSGERFILWITPRSRGPSLLRHVSASAPSETGFIDLFLPELLSTVLPIVFVHGPRRVAGRPL